MFDEHPHRRYADRKLEAIANNALLRVVGYAVGVIALPAITWALSTMLDRLNRIEANQNNGAVASATTDLRLLQTEKNVAELQAQIQRANERLLRAEFSLEKSKNGN